MTTSKRLHALGFSVVLSTADLFATLHSHGVATAASSPIDPAAVFPHLRPNTVTSGYHHKAVLAH